MLFNSQLITLKNFTLQNAASTRTACQVAYESIIHSVTRSTGLVPLHKVHSVGWDALGLVRKHDGRNLHC